MEIGPKPAYLKASTTKQAMIAFHSTRVGELRESLREQCFFDARLAEAGGEIIDDAWFAAYREHVANVEWEQGSITAVWRDRLAFHEASLEYLING